MKTESNQIVITGNELNAAIQDYFGNQHLRVSVDKIEKNDSTCIEFLPGDKIQIILDTYVTMGES
jgi:hypothetical protein